MVIAICFVVVACLLYLGIRFLFSRAKPTTIKKPNNASLGRYKSPVITVEETDLVVSGCSKPKTVDQHPVPHRLSGGSRSIRDIDGWTHRTKSRIKAVDILKWKMLRALDSDGYELAVEEICKLIDLNLDQPTFNIPEDFGSISKSYFGCVYQHPELNGRNGKLVLIFNFNTKGFWDSVIFSVYLNPTTRLPHVSKELCSFSVAEKHVR